MPDIASALQKALNDWEPPSETPKVPEQKPYFTVTNNVCRITFDYVRDNPGKTRTEVAKALGAQGFKPSSVTSLLGQMIKQGMMRESAHLLYVTVNEYAPLKSSRALKALAAKPQAQQRKIVTVTRKAAPEVEHTPLPPNVKFNATVPQLLDTLSIVQARALYDELKKIFGG